MDHGLSDSSGTDDDLPSSHQNRFQRGGRTAAGNGRSAVVGSVGNGRSAVAHLPRIHGGDMETQIHLIEQEAYSSVLRAFKAQSDALTWEKEGLITELRKELRVSDEEHRDLLSRVNADDMIRRIREWRTTGGVHPGMLSTSQPIRDPAPSPTVSGSHKRQKNITICSFIIDGCTISRTTSVYATVFIGLEMRSSPRQKEQEFKIFNAVPFHRASWQTTGF